MSIEELFIVLLGLLPIVKIEDNPSAKDRCKYMIGTKESNLMIKTNTIMVRVGGGYATVEDHIR